MHAAEITVISVAYSSAAVVPHMLESLGGNFPVIVVDNGPDDGARDIARKAGAIVLLPEANLGFGRACNLAAAQAETEFLLFLNPDSLASQEDVLSLHRAALRNPAITCFGPLLRDETGAVNFKRESILTPSEPDLPLDPGPEDRRVSTISGAAMLIRRDAFNAIGGFDPSLFMYYEDDDICLRLTAAGGGVMLVPSASFTHLSARSSKPSQALLRFKGYHWTRSRIHVLRKYGFPKPWLKGFKNALYILKPRQVIREPERLSEAMGRLAGALSMISRSRD